MRSTVARCRMASRLRGSNTKRITRWTSRRAKFPASTAGIWGRLRHPPGRQISYPVGQSAGAEITAHWTNNAEVEAPCLRSTRPAISTRSRASRWQQRVLPTLSASARRPRTTTAPHCRMRPTCLKANINLGRSGQNSLQHPNFKGTFDGQNKTVTVKI